MDWWARVARVIDGESLIVTDFHGLEGKTRCGTPANAPDFVWERIVSRNTTRTEHQTYTRTIASADNACRASWKARKPSRKYRRSDQNERVYSKSGNIKSHSVTSTKLPIKCRTQCGCFLLGLCAIKLAATNIHSVRRKQHNTTREYFGFDVLPPKLHPVFVFNSAKHIISRHSENR